jgi:hypothetical protein
VCTFAQIETETKTLIRQEASGEDSEKIGLGFQKLYLVNAQIHAIAAHTATKLP